MNQDHIHSSEKKKVLVGMSGGVDSSVSAALLVEQGFEVAGGFIKNWSDSKDLWTGECQWRGERRDAMRVAAKLGIPLLTFDFEEQYRKRVLDRMFAEYERGVTPNPDVLCNEEIKFGLFFEEAMRMGFDYVATGHYARVDRDQEGIVHLLKGTDPNKDQTYFLYRLSQDVLQKTLFPIGHLLKPQVREEGERFGLVTAAKPDSQGICFVGKLDFHEFLRKRIPERPGDVVDAEGRVLGQHDGLDAYTIGQRHGFRVSKDQAAWYVAKKDLAMNRLIVVPHREHSLMYTQETVLKDLHFTASQIKARLKMGSVMVEVAIRYRQEPVKAEMKKISDDQCMLVFAQPVWALAPGQSAVLYQGDECLGGGVFI